MRKYPGASAEIYGNVWTCPDTSTYLRSYQEMVWTSIYRIIFDIMKVLVSPSCKLYIEITLEQNEGQKFPLKLI